MMSMKKNSARMPTTPQAMMYKVWGISANKTGWFSITGLLFLVSLWLNGANDNPHPFHGDNFDRSAAFDERPFGDHIDALAVDDSGAGRAQRRQGRAGLIQQLRFFRADVPNRALRNE